MNEPSAQFLIKAETEAPEPEAGPFAASAAPSETQINSHIPELSIAQIVGFCVAAVAAFHLATLSPALSPMVLVYVYCLIRLCGARTWRKAFYPSLGVGYLIALLHLTFFFEIFSFGGAALWLVFALWIGLFPALGRMCVRHLPGRIGLLSLPALWMALEYFRSELYHLKFSWLSPGYVLPPGSPLLPLLGVYGTGFFVAALAAVAVWIAPRCNTRGLLTVAAATMLLGSVTCFPINTEAGNGTSVKMAGIQMEFPSEKEVLVRLEEVLKRHPETELVVLPEYAFDGPIPANVLNWCKRAKKHLIAGGKAPVADKEFQNTGFVVNPQGEVVFTQVKAVPIQFFKDGIPAKNQAVWHSPWGSLGICICYDLSYTRVTDALLRKGAQALIVPTMDVVDWGKRQHLLHARIAPARAAEYRLPVFRVASSGISQAVDRRGRVEATAPFPGHGTIMTATIQLAAGGGTRPADRVMVLLCLPLAAGLCLWAAVRAAVFHKSPTPS